MKVAFLSAEAAPLAKAGGLGDVVGALPKALKKMQVDVRIFLPFYGSIDKRSYRCVKVIDVLEVPVDSRWEKISVWQTKLPRSDVCVYLIKHKFFDAKNIYTGRRYKVGNNYTRTKIDVERFSFFTQSALAACQALNFQPAVVHAQDWHTALAADMIKTRNLADNFFINTKVLYTIHNLANQGITSPEIIRYAKVDPNFPIIKADAKNGDINFMVQGILGSDLINTVSRRYAVEILYHYQGAGLDNILRQRKKDLTGILNGIDTQAFDPATDKFIKYNYSAKDLFKKQNNKIFLQKRLGLPQDKSKCLVGFISRLVWQKGIELITDTLVKNADCQFVFLGSGQKEYEDYLARLAKKYPNKFNVNIKFDVVLAQQIYAASDMLLVPSRFEPCGLTQMIAMRYGSVPVARRTGGLADTINNYNYSLKRANGFLFTEFSAGALAKILNKAVNLYYSNPDKWLKLQKNCLRQDFSWERSARQYLAVYKKLLSLDCQGNLEMS